MVIKKQLSSMLEYLLNFNWDTFIKHFFSSNLTTTSKIELPCKNNTLSLGQSRLSSSLDILLFIKCISLASPMSHFLVHPWVILHLVQQVVLDSFQLHKNSPTPYGLHLAFGLTLHLESFPTRGHWQDVEQLVFLHRVFQFSLLSFTYQENPLSFSIHL